MKNEQDRFRFTPTKVLPKVPHLWERKPSTPFMARPKSRKVWKRFRSSFGSTKQLKQLTASHVDSVYHDAYDFYEGLQTEINVAKSFGFLRGVKRLCLQLGNDDTVDGDSDRGRSFLETKWEEDVIRRKRKLPTGSGCSNRDGIEPSSAPSLDVIEQHPEDAVEALDTPTKEVQRVNVFSNILRDKTNDTLHDDVAKVASAYPSLLEEVTITETTLDAAKDVAMTSGQQPDLTDQAHSPATTPNAEAAPSVPASSLDVLTSAQSTLQDSFDRENTELLNSFLSKAIAKRAANAVTAIQSIEEPPKGEGPVKEVPTPPPTRRALEEMDANSPSPHLKQQASPCKVDDGDKPADIDVAADHNDEEQSGSPVVRRSTRTRTPRVTPRVTPPSTTIALRRPKGTEFIFRKRTESQELSLTTRKNTRYNKGDAVLPKFVLEALAQQEEDKTCCSENETDQKPTRRRSRAKHVTWNEQRLVEYEGEEQLDDGSSKNEKNKAVDSKVSEKPAKSPGKGKAKGTRSKVEVEGGTGLHPATAPKTPATPPPPARRIQRLGKTTTSSVPLPLGTLANTGSRRKMLTPKSPSKTTAGAAVSSTAVEIKQNPGSSSGGSRVMARRSNSKSILNSNAGSTPMPKRVRARS
ncbi:hypothetical protein MPDQ_006510 [Monascus purpureus]|uniref:Uncharacterized protein n=1 Tax=Monascus purpureus TaxID=5098 RepID=A0A507QW87_MONPU|nr:hypothetical protein MPDQ_006510 [Monascus purpureus]